MSVSAARFQSSGVDVDGSTPLASRPTLPTSLAFANMPILPSYFGSKRDLMLVISSLMYFVLYPIRVNPDCQAIVYLLPGSQEGLVTRSLAYLSKLGMFRWSSGIAQPKFSRKPKG